MNGPKSTVHTLYDEAILRRPAWSNPSPRRRILGGDFPAGQEFLRGLDASPA